MKPDRIPAEVEEVQLAELAALLGVPAKEIDRTLLHHLWSLAPPSVNSSFSGDDLSELREFIDILVQSAAHSPSSLEKLKPRVERFVVAIAEAASSSVSSSRGLGEAAVAQDATAVGLEKRDSSSKKKSRVPNADGEDLERAGADPSAKGGFSSASLETPSGESPGEGSLSPEPRQNLPSSQPLRARGAAKSGARQVLQRFGVTSLSSNALAGAGARPPLSGEAKRASPKKETAFSRARMSGASCLCLGVEHGVFGVCLHCGRIRCRFEIPPGDYSSPDASPVACLFCSKPIMASARLSPLAKELRDQQSELTKVLQALETEAEKAASGGALSSQVLEARRDLKETEDYLRALELHRRLVTFDVEARSRTQVLDAASCWFDASTGRAGDEIKDIWLTPSQREERRQLLEHLQEAFDSRRGKVLVSIDFEKRTVTEDQSTLPEEAVKLLEAFTLRCQEENARAGVGERGAEAKPSETLELQKPLRLQPRRGEANPEERGGSAAAVMEDKVRALREAQNWPSLEPASEKAESIWMEKTTRVALDAKENRTQGPAAEGEPLLEEVWREMLKAEEEECTKETEAQSSQGPATPSIAAKLEGFARVLHRDLRGVKASAQTPQNQAASADAGDAPSLAGSFLRGRWGTGDLQAKLEEEATAAQRQAQEKAGADGQNWAASHLKALKEKGVRMTPPSLGSRRTPHRRREEGLSEQIQNLQTNSEFEQDSDSQVSSSDGDDPELCVWKEEEPLSKEERADIDVRDKGVCLTIRQPFASLVVFGFKTLEFREWKCPHVGRLWIHAAGELPSAGTVAGAEEFFTQEMLCAGEGTPAEVEVAEDSKTFQKKRRLLPPFPNVYPTGCVVGCVEMRSCMQVPSTCDGRPCFAFAFEKPQRLPVPVKTPGNRRLWHLPEKLLIHLQDSLLPARRPRLIALQAQTQASHQVGIPQTEKEDALPSDEEVEFW